MDTIKELLLSVQTSLENKGPYKLLIKKGDNPVQTLKIRMKDDVTFILQITQGDYTFILLKNDKEFLNKAIHIQNFETGSQLQVIINDTSIEIKDDGLIKYKSVDELVEFVEKGGKSKVAKDKTKLNNVKKSKESKEKTVVDTIIVKDKKNDPKEAKNIDSKIEQLNNKTGKDQQNINDEKIIEAKPIMNYDNEYFISFIKEQQETNEKLQNQINLLQKELNEIKACHAIIDGNK